jgi:hypothetical protein
MDLSSQVEVPGKRGYASGKRRNVRAKCGFRPAGSKIAAQGKDCENEAAHKTSLQEMFKKECPSM